MDPFMVSQCQRRVPGLEWVDACCSNSPWARGRATGLLMWTREDEHVYETRCNVGDVQVVVRTAETHPQSLGRLRAAGRVLAVCWAAGRSSIP